MDEIVQSHQSLDPIIGYKFAWNNVHAFSAAQILIIIQSKVLVVYYSNNLSSSFGLVILEDIFLTKIICY